MSWGRYLKLAVIVFVGSSLTLVEVLAQKGQLVARMGAENGRLQPPAVDQPKDAIRAEPDTAGKIEVAKNTDEDAARAAQPPRVAEMSATHPKSMPEALFLPSANKLSPLDKAYLDAFSILRVDNSCSRFYGGSRVIEVLNQLKTQLKSTYIDAGIAVRMSGPTMSVTSLNYGFSYRLFEKAELNLKGAFYHGNTFRDQEHVPAIGRFLPNTREARVTILLHELGHLVEKGNKQWLLPNDGHSESISHKNTLQIIAVCGEQIKQLSGTSVETQMQAARPASLDNVLRATIQP